MGIKLPGIGAILTREDLRFRGRILTVTAEREAGRWFACVTVECESPKACPGTELIGVDVGGRKIAACSDGTTYPAPKALRHQWGKIRRYRKHLARQKKGSAQRRCMLRKLRRATYRAACLREDAQHQAAKEIFAKGRYRGAGDAGFLCPDGKGRQAVCKEDICRCHAPHAAQDHLPVQGRRCQGDQGAPPGQSTE